MKEERGFLPSRMREWKTRILDGPRRMTRPNRSESYRILRIHEYDYDSIGISL